MKLDDLFEAIPISMAKPYMKADNSAQYDELFDRFKKYGRGKPNPKRLYFPLKSKGQTEDLSTAKEIMNLFRGIRSDINLSYNFIQPFETEFQNANLSSNCPIVKKLNEIFDENGSYVIDADLYKKGQVKTNNGKRIYKFGKLFEELINYYIKFSNLIKACNTNICDYMQNDDYYDAARQYIKELTDLKDSFQNDPIRSIKGQSNYFVVVSRHPYDLASMSTGRGWTSCTNLIDGIQRKYVLTYVTGANLIAYLVKEGDWNIEKPSARCLICRYNSIDSSVYTSTKESEYVFWPQETYGIDSQAFERTVKLFCKIANRGKDDGLYEPQYDQQYTPAMTKKRHEVNKMKKSF